MSVVNEVSRSSRPVYDISKDGYMPVRFGQQHYGRRIQKALQVFQNDIDWGRRMEYTGMSYHSNEFVDTRPGDCPRHGSLGETFQDLSGLNVMCARRDFSVNQYVGINCLHRLAPVHEVEEGIAVEQVDSGLFIRFPPPELQPVALRAAALQRAAKIIVGQRLKGAALFCRLPLELTEKVIINSQSGSCHV